MANLSASSAAAADSAVGSPFHGKERIGPCFCHVGLEVVGYGRRQTSVSTSANASLLAVRPVGLRVRLKAGARLRTRRTALSDQYNDSSAYQQTAPQDRKGRRRQQGAARASGEEHDERVPSDDELLWTLLEDIELPPAVVVEDGDAGATTEREGGALFDDDGDDDDDDDDEEEEEEDQEEDDVDTDSGEDHDRLSDEEEEEEEEEDQDLLDDEDETVDPQTSQPASSAKVLQTLDDSRHDDEDDNDVSDHDDTDELMESFQITEAPSLPEPVDDPENPVADLPQVRPREAGVWSPDLSAYAEYDDDNARNAMDYAIQHTRKPEDWILNEEVEVEVAYAGKADARAIKALHSRDSNSKAEVKSKQNAAKALFDLSLGKSPSEMLQWSKGFGAGPPADCVQVMSSYVDAKSSSQSVKARGSTARAHAKRTDTERENRSLSNPKARSSDELVELITDTAPSSPAATSPQPILKTRARRGRRKMLDDLDPGPAAIDVAMTFPCLYTFRVWGKGKDFSSRVHGELQRVLKREVPLDDLEIGVAGRYVEVIITVHVDSASEVVYIFDTLRSQPFVKYSFGM